MYLVNNTLRYDNSGESGMLCITMRKGDYFLIGKDIVVQLDTLSGSRVHLTINAPKDVPIVRGEVLERNGGKRPDCVYQD